MLPLLVLALVLLALFSLKNWKTLQLFGVTTLCGGAIFVYLDLVEVFHWFFAFMLLLDAFWHLYLSSSDKVTKELILIGAGSKNMSLNPVGYLFEEPSTHWVVMFF